MERSDEIARRARDNRFQQRRAELTADLARLLGPHGVVEPLPDAARAARLADEFDRAYRSAQEHDWARVARWWGADEASGLVDTLHRVSSNVGDRPAWLVLAEVEPQAVGTSSGVVLDNPLGFASLAEHELRLLDQQVPAGLWLVRHSYDAHGDVQYRWELEVWGAEPWLSAATRALRRVG